jgi:hypothetical protein
MRHLKKEKKGLELKNWKKESRLSLRNKTKTSQKDLKNFRG